MRRSRDRPFLTVWVGGGVADWIVRDDVINEIFVAVVARLMRFAWSEEKASPGPTGGDNLAVYSRRAMISRNFKKEKRRKDEHEEKKAILNRAPNVAQLF